MTPWASRIRNERGVALPMALFALVMLSGLLLAFLSMAGMEPSIAANQGDVTRGRYVADAGIEWAYDQLAAPTANWDTLLTTNGGVMTPPGDQTLPGLPATFGTFRVQVRNDWQAGDTAFTGQATLDPGLQNDDQNGIVIVTATGTLNAGTPNQVQRQIQVVVRRLALPPLPAPLNFPGVKANVNPGGTAHLHTNGVDTNRDGSNGSGPLKFGMTTPSGINPSTGQTFEKGVEDSLTRHHKNEMTGRDQTQPCCVAIARGSDESCPCEGERTIVPQDLLPSNERLTSQKIADFLSQVKASGAVNVAETTTPGQPLVVTDGQVTAWQGQGPSPSIKLGTVAKPTITYIKGRPDQSGRETVRLEGTGTNPDGSLKNAGAGILVVEDAYLEISGSFRWDGVILITGKDVGVTFKLGSRAFIYGGMVVNETNPTDNGGEMLIEQNTHGCSSCGDQFTTFFASQQNLDMVQNMPGLVKTSSWREN